MGGNERIGNKFPGLLHCRWSYPRVCWWTDKKKPEIFYEEYPSCIHLTTFEKYGNGNTRVIRWTDVDAVIHSDEDVEAGVPARQSARSSYLGQISGCVGILRLMAGMILTLVIGLIILYKLTNTEYTMDRALEDVTKLTNLVEPVVSPLRTAVGQYATRNATAH